MSFYVGSKSRSRSCRIRLGPRWSSVWSTVSRLKPLSLPRWRSISIGSWSLPVVARFGWPTKQNFVVSSRVLKPTRCLRSAPWQDEPSSWTCRSPRNQTSSSAPARTSKPSQYAGPTLPEQSSRLSVTLRGHRPIASRLIACPIGSSMAAIDLSTTYLGLRLSNPFMTGASPLPDHLDPARRLEDAGCAAIVLHSLFEEQISQAETGRIHHRDPLDPQFAPVVAYFPPPDSYARGPEEYLEHIRRLKE